MDVPDGASTVVSTAVPFEKLEEWAALRDAGDLSQTDFEMLKKKILDEERFS